MSSKADASTKILGFKYQEMVALVECLEAKDGTKIYLECLGDISDEKVSVEVKHSIQDDKKLIDTHIDFWKTLSNITIEYDNFRFYDSFILHTTAQIKEGSIFEKWNNLTDIQKKHKVVSITPNSTISEYYKNVISFDKKELLYILNRFIIKDNQKSAKEYYKDVLIKHPAIINYVSENHREEFICYLLGAISSKLINSDDFTWEIDINSFREDLRSYARRYQIEDLKFPISTIKIDESKRDNYKFVRALQKIEYEIKIGSSMRNYLKASDSQLKMIKARTSLSESLENYDEEIKEIILELKETHIDKLEEETDLLRSSRRFFDDSINKVTSERTIQGVTKTQAYYPKGRFLHNLEIESVSINLDIENES